MHATAADVVRRFWELMASNDFESVGAVLADDFVLEWPQSGERIHGRRNFARTNAEYPARGRWIFTVHRVVGNACEVVTDVGVTDGVQAARAISFFTVEGGKVARLLEFWPDPFVAPSNRAHLVEAMP